jgi:long-chain fatty acid transport protein
MPRAKLAFIAVVPILVLLFSGVSAPARAQGYGLYEQGACAMGRAGAGVASPCSDGSAIFFNPAGLALTEGVVISGGGTAVAPRGTFTNSKTSLVSPMNDKTYLAPAVYGAASLGKRVVVGAGVFAPYGLTTDWPTSTEGRFLGYHSAVKSIYVQPTVAFKVTEKVLVGGGVDITRTSLELYRRVDLSGVQVAPGITFAALGVPVGTDFADVQLTGSGVHVGGHFGLLIKATDRFSIGARYLTGQRVKVTNGQVATTQIKTNLALPVPLSATLPAGTPIDAIVASQFAAGATLSDQSATTSMPLPDQVVFGAAVQATSRVKIFADYQFTRWSMFQQIAIVNQYAPQTTLVENYDNSQGIRLGMEYAVGNKATVRAGFDGHSPGAPDQTVTPNLPEAMRKEVSLGAAVPLGSHLRLEVAYQHIGQSDRSGRTTDGGLAVPTVAVNNGTFHYYANLFGASFVVHF